MQQLFIIQQHRPRLLLFFAGWGMDATPFLHYRPRESDFLVVYDYRTLHFDTSSLRPYREVHLVAWSMGVWAASQVMPHSGLPITQSTAINGTPYPVDETRGISPALFQATLEGLNEASLLKFNRRMCLDKRSFDGFRLIAPQRSVEELKEELAAISYQQEVLLSPPFAWQQAHIGSNDRIFLPSHQAEAWAGTSTRVESGNEAHYDETLFQLHLEERRT